MLVFSFIANFVAAAPDFPFRATKGRRRRRSINHTNGKIMNARSALHIAEYFSARRTLA